MTTTMTVKTMMMLLLMIKELAFPQLCFGGWHQEVMSSERLWGKIVLGLNPDSVIK